MFTPEEKRTIVGFFEVLIKVYLREKAAAERQRAEQPKETETGNRLIPVTKWNDYHEWPTQGSLRWMIFMKHKNGFEQCLRKAGKRLLISEKDFFEWVDRSGKVR